MTMSSGVQQDRARGDVGAVGWESVRARAIQGGDPEGGGGVGEGKR